MESKPLSGKQLMRKASSKVAASAFLSEYESHIRSTYPASAGILDKYSAGEFLPSPTLEMLKQVIFAHIMENNKREKSPKSSKGTSGTGRYVCQMFVKKVTDESTGEHETELFVDHNGVHTFYVDTFQAAMNLVDRKQTDMGNSLYANITNKTGREITTVVYRDDSISRTMRAKKGPACRDSGMGFSKPLKNFMSCHQDTSAFSHG